MDIKSLKRDSDRVKKTLVNTDSNTTVTKTGCKVYFPVRFATASARLAEMGSQVETIMIFAMVVDGHYSVFNLPTKVQMTPGALSQTKIDGEPYYELSFDAGAVVFDNTLLVKVRTLPYYIYNELIAKGKIPWYLDYEDLAKLFLHAPKYAAVTLGGSNAIFEVIVSTIARQRGKLTNYHRHQIKQIDEASDKLEFIPLRDVIHGATNLTSRIMGSYLDQGIMSALVNPTDKPEAIEDLLRR